MALTREQKEELIQEYEEKLGRAQVLIWSHYSAIDVAQMTAFAPSGAGYRRRDRRRQEHADAPGLEARGLPYGRRHYDRAEPGDLCV